LSNDAKNKALILIEMLKSAKEQILSKSSNLDTIKQFGITTILTNGFESVDYFEFADQHFELVKYCNNKNISFFSTAFDLESLSFLKELGLNIVKIPSGEITNLPYLRRAASLFKEVILSTGMSTMDEIADALDVFLQAGISRDSITILHCNTEYPTPMRDVNLMAMLAIEKRFEVKVGYSDHTLGIEVPIAAVSLGAQMIEKHFTLDRSLPGPDQLASLEPEELKAMVNAIQIICQDLSNVAVYVSGGGLHNPLLMENIKSGLTNYKISSIEEIDMNPDAKEACLFALLANETIAGDPSNVNNIKDSPAVCMGKISLPQ
jgi:sialic acid synthase SpsE